VASPLLPAQRETGRRGRQASRGIDDGQAKEADSIA
jgi:hypothetical protein